MLMEVDNRPIYCSFPAKFAVTNKFYVCYRKERCCEEGCCIGGPYQIYQIWILILAVLALLSGATWLCKKPQQNQRQTRTSTTPVQCNRGGRCTLGQYNNEEIILDRLFLSFRNRNVLGDPPSYSSVVSANNTTSRFNSNYAFYGPPPTYAAARLSAPPPEVHAPPTRSVRIQIHTEDNSGFSRPGATAPVNENESGRVEIGPFKSDGLRREESEGK